MTKVVCPKSMTECRPLDGEDDSLTKRMNHNHISDSRDLTAKKCCTTEEQASFVHEIIYAKRIITQSTKKCLVLLAISKEITLFKCFYAFWETTQGSTVPIPTK